MPTPHLPVCIAGSEDAACEAQEMTVIAMNAAVQVALTANRESSLSRMQARGRIEQMGLRVSFGYTAHAGFEELSLPCRE